MRCALTTDRRASKRRQEGEQQQPQHCRVMSVGAIAIRADLNGNQHVWMARGTHACIPSVRFLRRMQLGLVTVGRARCPQSRLALLGLSVRVGPPPRAQPRCARARRGLASHPTSGPIGSVRLSFRICRKSILPTWALLSVLDCCMRAANNVRVHKSFAPQGPVRLDSSAWGRYRG
jgi:hypothetical protein